jgi:hypothetical protein
MSGLLAGVDDLLHATVTEPHDHADGPVAHPGVGRYANGRVAGCACVGVLLDGLTQGTLVVGHERSIENLTVDLNPYSFVDTMTDYAVEIVVPVRRTVYVDATTKAEARRLAQAGEWYDADEHREDTSKVTVQDVQEIKR